ncbi:MAG: hypothetical protein IKW74_00150 [Thermoguttaceae bacterium]|nr:hypothetical protein [Thermoguttaceae bacterium]
MKFQKSLFPNWKTGGAVLLCFLVSLGILTRVLCAVEVRMLNPEHPERLPDKIDGRQVLHDVGCFWGVNGLSPEETHAFPDQVMPTGAFDSLLLTVRSHESIVDNKELHDATREAVEYAKEKYGTDALLDIDVRIARKDIAKTRPDLLQERLFLQERDGASALPLDFETGNLTDHYTGNYPYTPERNRLVRVWKYQKNDQGEIIPETISDVTATATFTSVSAGKCSVSVDAEPGTFVCAAVAFALLYPDIFAPETLALERQIYEYYRDVPAAGVGKDEWGLPPWFGDKDGLNDYWYSGSMETRYAEMTTRSLVEDFFLMFRPQAGRSDLRLQCFDDFRRFCLKGVLEYQTQNYYLSKELWGKETFIGVHGTWFPWPNIKEFRKNGLMWWQIPCDYAQTDEYAPFCCRNGMAKAVNATWVNMFYATTVPPYIYEHWTAALSGGRVHIHGIYPVTDQSPTHPVERRILPITEAGVDRIRSRIRLLNLVTNSPLDSAVAVVFGHFGVMNPLRPEYTKVGVDLCDWFALRGYPADLIPSDEVNTKGVDGKLRWSLNAGGYLQYGAQAYRFVLFYGVNDSDRADFAALKALAGENCKTKIIEIPVNDSAAFEQAGNVVLDSLKSAGIPGQTPWTQDKYRFMSGSDEVSTRPALNGYVRLIDGTWIWTAAENNVTGDELILDNEPILAADGATLGEVSVKCVGLFACRFDDSGKLVMMTATDLKSFRGGDLEINLGEDSTVDVVLRRAEDGSWKGILQAEINDLPEPLKAVTDDWSFLKRIQFKK